MGKTKKIAILSVLFVVTALSLNALTKYFAFRSESSNFSKKHIFAFELVTGFNNAEVGPGDSVTIRPMVKSNSTEEMYVFINMKMPFYNGAPLYEFVIDEDWTLVESTEGSLVYAYANPNMITLYPGDETSILTKKLTMKSVMTYEYAYIEDVNVSFYAYAVGTEDISEDPTEAWAQAKGLFGLQ